MPVKKTVATQPRLPTSAAELATLLEKVSEAAVKAARDEGFTAGVISALGVVTSHDQGTLWGEIVNANDHTKLIQLAKSEGEDWAWAGFERYARRELGSAVVSKALSGMKK